MTRVRVASAKRRWRRAHPQAAGRATPVYLVGLQRSGTNMLARGLDTAPEFEVHNENDRAAFSPLPAPGRRRRSAASSWQASTDSCSSSRSATRIGSTICSTRSTRHRRAARSGRTATSTVAPARRSRSSAGTICSSLRDIAAGNARRDVAGAAALRGDARADPQLRLRDDDARNGRGALLVGSQRPVLRPRFRPPRRRAARPRTRTCSRTPSTAMQSICRFLGLEFRDDADRAHLTARCRVARVRSTSIRASARSAPSCRTVSTRRCACRREGWAA